MSTNLFLRGELRIKPGHEAAVEALAEVVQPEEYSRWVLSGTVLEIDIDEDVPAGHYGAVWEALETFVNEHCEDAAALQTGASEREFHIFGSDFQQRQKAHRRYCNNEILYWTNLRDQASRATER
jgi:hypothetical protein